MILGCPIAFCLICSSTLYFITNDMAIIMVIQRLTEGANTLPCWLFLDSFWQAT